MARKPASSSDKLAAKEKANKGKAAAMAANALAKLPAEKETRNDLFREGVSLKAAAQSAAGDISAHKKRLTDVFGFTKAAIKIREILLACKDGEYEATLKQVKLLMDDIDRPFQMGLPLEEPGKGVADDDTKPLFDSTRSGDQVSAERGDDPARAGRRRGPPPPPAVVTPNVGVEGLAEGIKQLETPEEKRARIEAEKAADAAAFAAEEGKVEVKDEPKVEAKAKPVGTGGIVPGFVPKDDTTNMTPAQRKAHAKKLAEQVFTKQGTKGLGAGGVH